MRSTSRSGLPIVRTAPDHGTAFDIAGQDRADPRPMAAAIRMAAECAVHARRSRLSARLEPLRDVIARHGLSASKALGQNFILDRQLLARIAAVPGRSTGERVYEVGPGPGRPDARAARCRRVGRRGRARPPLHPGAGRASAGVRRQAADHRGRRAEDRRAQPRPAKARTSSPTCPTMSAPRCCCNGSAATGRRGGDR